MLENLLRPFLLARFGASFAATALVVVGLAVGWKVLRHFRIARTSEGQLALERRAELVSSLVEVALGATIVGLAIALLGADRMTASIRGAMCAWGVLDASPWGFRSLAISSVATLACALWIVLHRLDVALARPVLTRLKFAALFVVAPWVLVDLAASTAYALDLDLRVLASCCSTGLDEARSVSSGSATGGPRDLAVGLFGLGALGAIVLSLVAQRRPSRAVTLGVAGSSALSAVASLPTVVLWVAPHVYETPVHLCPFCLLHGDALGIGWALALLGFLGTAFGLGTGLVGALADVAGEPATTDRMARRLARRTAFVWSAFLVLAALPFVRWTLVSDGVSLFAS